MKHLLTQLFLIIILLIPSATIINAQLSKYDERFPRFINYADGRVTRPVQTEYEQKKIQAIETFKLYNANKDWRRLTAQNQALDKTIATCTTRIAALEKAEPKDTNTIATVAATLTKALETKHLVLTQLSPIEMYCEKERRKKTFSLYGNEYGPSGL